MAQHTGRRSEYVIASTYRLSDHAMSELQTDFIDAGAEHGFDAQRFLIVKKPRSEVIILSCSERYGDQFGGIARVILIQLLRSYIKKYEELNYQGQDEDNPFLKIFEEATMTVTDAAIVDTERTVTPANEIDDDEEASRLRSQVAERQCLYGDHKKARVAFLQLDRLPVRSKSIIERNFQRNRLTGQADKLLFLRVVTREDDENMRNEFAYESVWEHTEAVVEPLQPADAKLVATLDQGIKFYDIEQAKAEENQSDSNTDFVSNHTPLSPPQKSKASCSTSGSTSSNVDAHSLDTLDQSLTAVNLEHAMASKASRPPSLASNRIDLSLRPSSRTTCAPDHQKDQHKNDADSDNESFYTAANDTAQTYSSFYTHHSDRTLTSGLQTMHARQEDPKHCSIATMEDNDEDQSSDDDSDVDVLALISGSQTTHTSASSTQSVAKKTYVQATSQKGHNSKINVRPEPSKQARMADSAFPAMSSVRTNYNEIDKFGVKGLAPKEADHRRKGNPQNDWQTEWSKTASPDRAVYPTPRTYQETVLGGEQSWAANIVKGTQPLGPPNKSLLIDIHNTDDFPPPAGRSMQSQGRAQNTANTLDFNAPPLTPVRRGGQSPGAQAADSRNRGPRDVESPLTIDRLAPSPPSKPIFRRNMRQKARKATVSGFESHVKEVLAEYGEQFSIIIEFGMFAFRDSQALSAVYDQHELASCFRTKTSAVVQVETVFLPQLLQSREAVQLLSIPFDNENLLLDNGIAYDAEVCFIITLSHDSGRLYEVRLLWSAESGFRVAPRASSVDNIAVHNSAQACDAQVSIAAKVVEDSAFFSRIAESICGSFKVFHYDNEEMSVEFGQLSRHTLQRIVMEERYIRRAANLMLPAKYGHITQQMDVGWMVVRSTSLTIIPPDGDVALFWATTERLYERYDGSVNPDRWETRFMLDSKTGNTQPVEQSATLADLMQHVIGRISHSFDSLHFGTGLSRKKEKKKATKPRGFW